VFSTCFYSNSNSFKSCRDALIISANFSHSLILSLSFPSLAVSLKHSFAFDRHRAEHKYFLSLSRICHMTNMSASLFENFISFLFAWLFVKISRKSHNKKKTMCCLSCYVGISLGQGKLHKFAEHRY